MRKIRYINEDIELMTARSFKNLTSEKKELTTEQLMKRYWRNMNNRVKTESYSKKGIKVVWSYDEFCSWWYSNEKFRTPILDSNLTPSIDRIDSNKHYEASNCRWLPVEVNRALGEVNALIERMKQLQAFLKENENWMK